MDYSNGYSRGSGFGRFSVVFIQQTMIARYPNTIKSISDNQDEIIQNILELHCETPIELDPTYSTGQFYKNIPKPKLKFDLFPKSKEVKKADARKLPLENESITTMIFDPPFISKNGHHGEPNSKMRKRFSDFGYKTEDLWNFYDECLKEFHRILKPKGVLIFKNQDVCGSGNNYFSH